MILLPLVEDVPYTRDFLQRALDILQDWGLSIEDIERLLAPSRISSYPVD
jgi:hypothetical protein